MKRKIRLERSYPHPRELVWRTLTDRELLAAWLMPSDFEPVVGRVFTMRTDPGPGFDGIVHAKVLALDPPRRMSWSWHAGPVDSVVTFSLEETIVFSRPGTRLILEHEGFEGVPAVLTSFILGAGWASMLKRRFPVLLQQLRDGEAARLPPHTERSRWGLLRRLFAPLLKRHTGGREAR